VLKRPGTDIPVLTFDNYIVLKSGIDDSQEATIITTDSTISETNPIIVPDGWLGLFQNGTSSGDGLCNNYQISNIHIKCEGTLEENGGGICREYFGKGMISTENLIENCSFQGIIGGMNGGGICGEYCGYLGQVTIKNCYSDGGINGNGAGGICGRRCGKDGVVHINNCYSIGTIKGPEAGGICGAHCGEADVAGAGAVTINNCYSDGGIEGRDAGGICGSYCGIGGTVTINNCLLQFKGASATTSAITNTNARPRKLIGIGSRSIAATSTANFRYSTDANFNEYALKSIALNVTCVWDKLPSEPWKLLWQRTRLTRLTFDGYTCITSPGTYVLTTNDPYNVVSGEIPIIVPLVNGKPTLDNTNYILLKSGAAGGQETIITTDSTITPDNPIIVPHGWKGLFENGTWRGIFQNGTWVDKGLCDNFEISDIHIKCMNYAETDLGTLKSFGGGICRKYFGNGMNSSANLIENCSFQGIIGTSAGGICGHRCGEGGQVTITNCYSQGDIEANGGGICGHRCGDGGQVTITNCYSLGNIEGGYAGGICGKSCGKSGTVTINNCYSKGNIGPNAGGICGQECGDAGHVTINNCYSIGNIDTAGGGICGTDCGDGGQVTINNCYSIGQIGDYAGGICGDGCGDSGTVTINNCYSIGDIGIFSGGICGEGCGVNWGTVHINNCYSHGNIEGTDAGGICGEGCGSLDGTVTIKNCLYNSDGCENNSIRMASITNATFANDQYQFKKVIGSLSSDFKSIDIDNTHYFADMDDFHTRALLSINVSVTSVWTQCPKGPWLLQWQTEVPCSTLPAGGDKECTITLDSDPIPLPSGDYIITRNEYYITNETVLTPIFLTEAVAHVLTTEAVIILGVGKITITCDLETINETIPIIVPNEWKGLFQNGTESAIGLCNNYKISNIHIKCEGTVGEYGGGICREYFGNGMKSDDNLIENCSFQGIIGNMAGGICGRYCGQSGKVDIYNCYSIGQIGRKAGGICGAVCGNLGTVTITNCYSLGTIEAGGICGSDCGYEGTVTINNCYSHGTIGNYAGGICGQYCGNKGTVTINNCYSIGTIEGRAAGGICGEDCGETSGQVTIKNCLYNYDGCENNSIRMASITESALSAQAFVTDNQDKFKKVIGSLAPNFMSIDIDNTHYFADMDDFHTRAEKSIAFNATAVWHPCTNGGPWLLKWQDDTCGTLPAGGDPRCTIAAKLDDCTAICNSNRPFDGERDPSHVLCECKKCCKQQKQEYKVCKSMEKHFEKYECIDTQTTLSVN
jgi:hypothetical protein